MFPVLVRNLLKWRSWLPISLIMALALALRLHDLGRNSLWNDEAGQALAAMEPTLRGAFKIARSHVMAMPLDYLLSWVVFRLSPNEAIIRLPAVLWGTLVVLVYYRLIRVEWGEAAALLTAGLITTSTNFLYYSQEMRFYSALFFFYGLATLLLLRALASLKPRDWLLFLAVSVMGVYFHPHVFFVFCNGLAYLFSNRLNPPERKKRFVVLTGCAVLVGIAFIPGYMVFDRQQTYTYGLLGWGGTLDRNLLTGLGWLSFPFVSGEPLFGLWEIFNVILFGAGLWSSLHAWHKTGANLTILLLVSVAAQSVLVIVADLLFGYWFAHRQIIYLSPFVMLISALGALWLFHLCKNAMARHGLSRSAFWLAVALCLLMMALSMSRVIQYYAYQKSDYRRIADYLVKKQNPGQPVFVIPGYEEKVIRYYLSVLMPHVKRTGDVRAVSFTEIRASTAQLSGPCFLVTPAMLSAEQREAIASNGFRAVILPEIEWYGTHDLFIRD